MTSGTGGGGGAEAARPSDPSLVAEQKAVLRARLLEGRRAVLPATAEASGPALAAALAPLLAGVRCVASYVSIGGEPSTTALHEALDGVDVLLPVLLPGGDLDWALAGRLARTGRGLLEPTGPRLGRDAVASADLVVVPALAVDRRGRRLGRGGGSYDRALARVGVTAVALLHDGELLDVLPAEPHDRPVTAVATPRGGLLALAGGMGP